MSAMLMMASVSFVACGDKEKDKDEPTTYEESTTFAFYYGGQKIAAGGTVEAIPTEEQTRNDFAQMNLMIENKLDTEVGVKLNIVKVEGPSSADHIELCFDGSCRENTCPWTTDMFTLGVGQANSNIVTYDYMPSAITKTIIYRLTVGKGENMEDPQVIFIKHTI